jgi:hypothetical protein
MTVLIMSNFVGSEHSTARKKHQKVIKLKVFVSLKPATVPRNTSTYNPTAAHRVLLK